MREQGWAGGKYLIDGFPRSFDNLAAWEQMAGDQVLVKFVLYLDVCQQVMEARLLERGKTSGRADDNIESIRKRFLTFHQESRPVVEKFQADGRVIRIDAEQHRDDVWRDVQALFGPSVVFVLGGPGSGKGTQCTKIAESFGYTHLSAGDLLREERSREGSEYGELINSYIKDGKLVPVEITIKLLKQAMMKFGWEGGRYLIDGFPRSFDNLGGWETVIGNSVRVKFVLFFDASEETMQVRLMERGKTSGRADDNLESIKKRFVTFQQESMPVVEHYRLQGLVRRIDAEQDSEKVWSDVQRNFGPQVIFVLGGPGAGKGTQCARIAANFGFQHLSAGDLLREERKRPGSELGELIESHIKEGKLVPVSVVVRLLQKAMEERGWEDGKYLIDGFPRSNENMQGWNDMIGSKVDVRFCLFFDCSEAVMEARLLERGKTSGRSDDNLESIKKRFATYTQESLPVVESFSREGAMRRINAEQGLDEVWSCVQEVMHNEQDGHLLNQALVLIKPSSFNKDTQRFVQSFFTTHKISIVEKGVVAAKDIAEKNMFDKQANQNMSKCWLAMPAGLVELSSHALHSCGVCEARRICGSAKGNGTIRSNQALLLLLPHRLAPRSVAFALLASACLWLLYGQLSFVNSPATKREINVVRYDEMPAERPGYYPVGNAKRTAPYGERDPLPEGYGIRTGLSDLLKPLNAEAGVVAKEDSIPTVLVMVFGIVMLFLFYLLLLLLDNQSVLLPPEDEFDEYVANFLPYFFFGEK
ncbi:cmpk [Symbiodinium natans]|uniref:UMP-CMP kinase n=1 Tax=Symbiodinium natans TaxID=878477 RepID=A0A812UML3_9DINO|nr:cmpk [Symbiodinium natans]